MVAPHFSATDESVIVIWGNAIHYRVLYNDWMLEAAGNSELHQF